MVLNYTQSRQLNLLRDLGFESPSWEDLGLLMAACLVLLSLVGAAWALWERRQHDPWVRLFEAAQRRLHKTDAAPDLTPRALAQALAHQHGATAPRVQAWRDWLLRLEALRYAPGTAESAKRGLTALRREFKQLHWPL